MAGKQQYQISLTETEEKQLKSLLKKGTDKARKLTRCRILLLSSKGESQRSIAETLSITTHTVRNICLKYLREGLEGAINEKDRSGAPTIFDGKAKARLTALACSEAESGRSQWSLRLLADKAIELDIVDSISHSTVRSILKKTK